MAAWLCSFMLAATAGAAAPASGILAGMTAQPDDVIPVSEVIAYILEPGEPLPAGPQTPQAPTELAPAALDPVTIPHAP